jgi:hypothetical protein
VVEGLGQHRCRDGRQQQTGHEQSQKLPHDRRLC